MLRQRTIKALVRTSGVGLHSGQRVELTLRPAAPDTGIVFRRVDLEPAVDIKAEPLRVTDTRMASTLTAAPESGGADVRVATVEHLMSALAGLGIDNLYADVTAAEIPILDGSAGSFVFLIQSAGIVEQSAPKRFIRVLRPVEVRDGDRLARIEPSDSLSIDFTVDFGHPLITNQSFRFVLSDRAFEREVARARTFCLLRDVEKMQSMGLARGGSLDNAVVVDDFSILNPEGLRFSDEFARHKVLDALGDLSLAGLPIIGAFRAVKSGHAMNQALVRQLLADAASHRVVRISAESELEPLHIRLPALAAPEARTA